MKVRYSHHLVLLHRHLTLPQGSLQNGVTTGERTMTDVDFPWPEPATPMMFYLSTVCTLT